MHALHQRWMGYWFAPVEPTNLGVCRALFFGAFFLFYVGHDFSAWAEVAPEFWMPTWFFETLRLSVLPPSQLEVLEGLWKLSLALSCLGLCTRVSTATAFVLGFYCLGLPHSLGKVSHADGVVVIGMLIMAVSRCGDGFSLDRRIIGRGRGPAPPSGEYRWPVRAVWLTFALIFFAAGVAKLRYGGASWFQSDSFQIILIQAMYRTDDIGPVTAWGLHLAQYGWLCRLLAASTVAFEFGYPLALVSRPARWIIVPSVLLMQVGIRLMVGPSFPQFIICNLFWVPWDRVAAAVRPVLFRRSLRQLPASR